MVLTRLRVVPGVKNTGAEMTDRTIEEIVTDHLKAQQEHIDCYKFLKQCLLDAHNVQRAALGQKPIEEAQDE